MVDRAFQGVLMLLSTQVEVWIFEPLSAVHFKLLLRHDLLLERDGSLILSSLGDGSIVIEKLAYNQVISFGGDSSDKSPSIILDELLEAFPRDVLEDSADDKCTATQTALTLRVNVLLFKGLFSLLFFAFLVTDCFSSDFSSFQMLRSLFKSALNHFVALGGHLRFLKH